MAGASFYFFGPVMCLTSPPFKVISKKFRCSCCDRGEGVTPQFVRAVLCVLIVRAIFISPSQGSEFGPAPGPSDSSLKRLEMIRPSRLRFTKPCPPSASQERIACLDGGDDEERTPPAEPSAEAWFARISSRPALAHRPLMAASARSFVRLRC